jgi:hypothetical protein
MAFEGIKVPVLAANGGHAIEAFTKINTLDAEKDLMLRGDE